MIIYQNGFRLIKVSRRERDEEIRLNRISVDRMGANTTVPRGNATVVEGFPWGGRMDDKPGRRSER